MGVRLHDCYTMLTTGLLPLDSIPNFKNLGQAVLKINDFLIEFNYFIHPSLVILHGVLLSIITVEI